MTRVGLKPLIPAEMEAPVKKGVKLSCSLAAGLALTFGCAPRRVSTVPPPPPAVGNDYVDIQPGWRIRLVVPVPKSSTSTLHLRTVEGRGNAVDLTAGNNLIGYEVAFYSAKSRPGGGVAIRFTSAEIRKGKKVTKQSQPLVSLLDLPPRIRFVRLLFLAFVGAQERKEGILGATSVHRLNALTLSVEHDPDRNCMAYAEALCVWVPRGMAAQPEKRDPAIRGEWVPAW